jgi:DNA-binding NarL/FixJ family response regulator
MMIQLLIVDDHPMVLEGIKTLLQDVPDLRVVGTANEAGQALALLAGQAVDVVLLDINLPGTDGIALCQMIRQDFPQVKVLGVSTFKERSYISKMIAAGALGYVLKSVDRDALLLAIRRVAAGQFYLEPELALMLVPENGQPTQPLLLTRREKEILACIANGQTTVEIATQLFVSPLTVESHRKNLLAKFGAKNTAALIKLAGERGLL